VQIDKPKTVLLTDSSHPELKEIAKALHRNNENFYFISGIIFSQKESIFLRRIFVNRHRYQRFISNRTLSIEATHLIRSMALFEAAFFFLTYLPYRFKPRFMQLQIDKIDKIAKLVGKRSLEKLLKKSYIKTVIGQNSFDFSKVSSSTSIVKIAYHGEKSHEKYWFDIAAKQWPKWTNSWNVSGDFPNPIELNRSTYTLVSSSFIASHEPHSDSQFIVIPLGQESIHEKSLLRTYEHQTLNFIFLGSLGLRKGVPALLEAAKHLGENSRLQILGRSDKSTVAQIMEDHYDNVEVFFEPNREFVLETLANSDVFLFPSYFEGFGISILEAMSSGCIPVVSRNTCGPDILAGTIFENLLFEAGNLSEFMSKIKQIEALSKSELRTMQEESRKLSSHFTFERYGEDCVSKFQSLGILSS